MAKLKSQRRSNYRTKPEKDGLFARESSDRAGTGRCHCGKYKRSGALKALSVTDAIEVTSQRSVKRIGHIALVGFPYLVFLRESQPYGLILDISQNP